MFAKQQLFVNELSTMNKLITYTFAAAFSLQVWAQTPDSTTANEVLPPVSFLDSIKKSFVHHELAACVDRRWTNEILSSDLFAEMSNDIEQINIDEVVDFDLSTSLLKKRLKHLDSKSAFDIEYNQGLENIIKYYLKNRKRSFERLIGLSEYYFPVFEEHLAKYNVPLEIKYLAIVESALNPRAVSHMGATGLWQFMYGTGKQYKLDIDTFVDERSDLLKSTEAACQYMTQMYEIFGDWDLVLASYNAGPGNVAKAIRRSGGKQNYWNIRPFLPKETQGYVPAFLATMYVFEYHKEHGISPKKFDYNPMLTDTIQVKSKITFKQLSDLLDISVEELQFLNPSYKRDLIPHVENKKHYLRLPLDKVALFTSNEEKVYAYVNHNFNLRERPNDQVSTAWAATSTKTHTVRKGENLGVIARKYGVSVDQLRKLNNIKGNNIAVGKKLKVETQVQTAVAAAPKPQPKPQTKPQTIVAVDSSKTNQQVAANVESATLQTVSKGETLNQLSQKYQVSVDDLKSWNNLENSNIKIGAQLVVSSPELVEQESSMESQSTEIPKKKIQHVIQKGETLNSIAQKYQVTTDDLKSWNELNSNQIVAGRNLVILSNDAEILNDSQRKQQAIKTTDSQSKYYMVKKGDSLFSISQKLEGVSVSDLKRWNEIKGSQIKPGMKLKISGT